MVLGDQAEDGGINTIDPRIDEEVLLGLFLQSDNRVFFHVDHLGSPRVVMDGDGTLLERHTYLPFGEGKMSTAVSTALKTTNTREFTGHERDKETGLDYMLARYYDSSLGRFMAVDPLASSAKLMNPQTWNRFTYVVNNPLVLIDPTGETLTVSGSDSALNKFQETADSGLFGKETNIDSNGNVTLQDNGVQGPPTPEQAAFEGTLNQSISNTGNVSVSVSESSSETLVGSHALGDIDMNDVQALGSGPGVTAVGALGHEIAEQFATQIGGMGFSGGAHDAGIAAENRINGSTRGPQRGSSRLTLYSGSTASGTVTIPYTRGGATTNCTLHVCGGNVVNVTRSE